MIARYGIGDAQRSEAPALLSDCEEDILRFIAASFPSVWALEVVLALRNDRRPWASDELVSALRASELVVSKALDALVAAGIASIDAAGAIYLPVNSHVDECVSKAEGLYRMRPNKVRQAIVAASSSGAAAFANAFKLRRDEE